MGQIIHTISYMALPLLLAMVFHEYAHGWVADRYGDSTARLEGRLTLNPVPHIDPFGTILLPLLCLIFPSAILAIDPSVADSLSASGPGVRRDLLGMFLVPLAWMCWYSVIINVVLMVF